MSPAREGKQEPSGRITIKVQRLPANATVVTVAGDLTVDATAAMQRTVSEELTRSPAQLIVDLTAVKHIDGDGINALESAAGIAGEADISFCLVHSDGNPVGTALAAAKLTDLFETFPTVNRAVRAHRPPPQP